MAGNTLLTGLRVGNKIQVERWGKSELVELDEASMERLRKALYNELPVQPPRRKLLEPVSYEHTTGHVLLRMSPREAEVLLETFMHVEGSRDIDYPQEWIEGISAALRDHKRYVDRHQEPGIDRSVDEGYAHLNVTESPQLPEVDGKEASPPGPPSVGEP